MANSQGRASVPATWIEVFLVKFEQTLVAGRLIRRYKRFLADVELEDGTVVTAHVANTGSMMSTNDPASEVALSHHPAPHRKLKWTLELIKPPGGSSWVGVNTALPNRIVAEAITAGRIRPLKGYDRIRNEVKYGDSSRIDLLLEAGDKRCYVEVKNVTYRNGRRALFPDAVTKRGAKHLAELSNMVALGHRGVTVYLVNRGDCTSMGPATSIDPAYTEALKAAVASGVELLAYRAGVSPAGIAIERKLPIIL